MFYIVTPSADDRSHLIERLREQKISTVFHYLSLHKSEYYAARHDGRELPNADHFTDCLVRLPMFYELDPQPVIEALHNL